LKRLLRQARDRLADALRSLPVSSRIVGPPKGCYSSFEEYIDATGDRIAKSWPVVPNETRRLNVPGNASKEWEKIFQPVVHESPGFGLYRIQNGRFHRDSRAIITSDDHLLTSFSAWMGNGPRDNWLFRKIKLEPVKPIGGKTLLLVLSRNYYHFLIEELPRIRIAEQAGFPLEFFDQGFA
jgi:hypothetical protein